MSYLRKVLIEKPRWKLACSKGFAGSKERR
jgi:hypothetical protein